MGETEKGRLAVEKHIRNYGEVITSKNQGEDLYWVKCPLCKSTWVCTKEEGMTPICYQDKCQYSFEAKVLRATGEDTF